VSVPDFDYTARPAQKLEVPLAERIAAIRKKKSDERARAALKTARAHGPRGAQPRGATPAARPSGAAPPGGPARDRQPEARPAGSGRRRRGGPPRPSGRGWGR
jgi:ATP-dependent RNA helicase RhlE